MSTVTDRIILEARIIVIALMCALVAAGVFYLRAQAQLDDAQGALYVAKSQTHQVVHRLVQYLAIDFANDHELRMKSEMCTWKEEAAHCTALLDTKVIAYSCTEDGCRFDECGAIK